MGVMRKSCVKLSERVKECRYGNEFEFHVAGRSFKVKKHKNGLGVETLKGLHSLSITEAELRRKLIEKHDLHVPSYRGSVCGIKQRADGRYIVSLECDRDVTDLKVGEDVQLSRL